MLTTQFFETGRLRRPHDRLATRVNAAQELAAAG